MAKAALLFDDRVGLATVTDTSHDPLTTAANLKTSDLGAVWRTEAGINSAQVLVDFGGATEVGGLVLGGYTGPAASGFRVRLSTVDATGAAGDAYDSGSLSGVFDPAFRHFVHFLVSDGAIVPATGRYLLLDVARADTAAIEAGYLMAGPVWVPTHNFRKGAERRVETANEVTRSRGGARWVSVGARWRRWRGSLPWVTDAEALAQLEPLAQRAADGLPVLWCEDFAAPSLGAVSWLGELAGTAWSRVGHDRHDLPLDIMELI